MLFSYIDLVTILETNAFVHQEYFPSFLQSPYKGDSGQRLESVSHESKE